jgi:cytidylate kinase
MKETPPFVVTISRQVASGGAYLGKRLGSGLNVLRLDRGIISQAAAHHYRLEATQEIILAALRTRFGRIGPA